MLAPSLASSTKLEKRILALATFQVFMDIKLVVKLIISNVEQHLLELRKEFQILVFSERACIAETKFSVIEAMAWKSRVSTVSVRLW